MSSGGLSKTRLARMHDVMSGYVERGETPGLTTVVSRRGEVHIDTIGQKTIDGDPIQRDTIFRISSMTKPITAVATMILVEECKLRLDEPVDRLLSELANRRVLKRFDGPLDETVPANRPITVRDLLTFCLGFGNIMAMPGTYPIQRAEEANQLMTLSPPKPRTPHDPDEWLRRFATLPLLHQPGQQWMYNTGSNILGILIARASGQSLEAFFRERIFEPLGMKDTGFSVPPEKLSRLSASYGGNRKIGGMSLFDGVEDSQWSTPPPFPDGGGGLVSTADDYLAFGQMMLNNGKLGNERILSRLSVETMTTDQLTPEQKAGDIFFTGGWGFGVSVVTNRDSISSTPGRYGWDGGLGTSWSTDPKEELVSILLTTRIWESPAPPGVYLDFWTSVYQSIDD